MRKWTPVCASALLLLFGGFFLGFSGSVDDAHITFSAAQIFAQHGEILNINLARVEQSSSLLLVLVLGTLNAATHISVVTLGHVSTIFIAVLVLLLSARLAKNLSVQSSVLWLLASAPFFMYWSFGGMEGPWLALLLLALLLLLPNCLAQHGINIAVVFLSIAIQIARPEMPVVLCVFAFVLLPVKWLLRVESWSWRALWTFLGVQILLAALLVSCRYIYFCDIFPQPVSVKSSGVSTAVFVQGLQYFYQTWGNIWLLPIASLMTVGTVYIFAIDRRPQLLLLAMLSVVYAGFVVASGGDWMAAGRFWTPILPLLCMVVMLVLERFVPIAAWRNAVVLVLVALNAVYAWRSTAIDFNGVPLWKKTLLTADDQPERFSFFERHARENLHDIPVTVRAENLMEKITVVREQQGNHTPVVWMAGQMGMVPFYLSQSFARKIRFIDRNGITERTLSDCAPAAALPRTRNGIGVGYEWILNNRDALEKSCGFVMPDVVFDIETGWNRRNIKALEQAGYVFVYRQRGHVFDEPDNALLPLRKIGAGEFLAVSHALWLALGSPAPVTRVF